MKIADESMGLASEAVKTLLGFVTPEAAQQKEPHSISTEGPGVVSAEDTRLIDKTVPGNTVKSIPVG